MLQQEQRKTQRAPEAPPEKGRLLARLDRIDTWSLPWLFVGIIGLGFLFTFYDIFDINVSFIQTCTALKHGCTPANAVGSLKLPVLLNLAGYVVGTLVFSPLADRVGRRNMLMLTMALTGLGSLYTALAPDYTNFILGRVITGVGIGADLAIVNTFIGEMAPRRSRAKFTALIFVNSALGALLGIWLGLLLTTPSAPWPDGLPFALADKTFTDGWRWMYAIGALLAVVAIALRFRLPESPRWLLARGRTEEAEDVVEQMERAASKRKPLPEPEPVVERDDPAPAQHVPYRDILLNPRYLRRVLLLMAVWLLGYATVYGFSAGFTTLLTALGHKPSEAGVIVAVGGLGFLACAIVAFVAGERLGRRWWLPISAVITLGGGALVAEAGDTTTIAFLGSAIIFFGFNLWVPMTYARSAENFPTRARTTGFALVDGIGHLGGGIGILVLAPAIPHLSPLGAFTLIGGFLALAAIVGMFGVETRNKRFEQISP